MTRVTVIDVAKRAGVSKSTVSLVLNDSERVNPATADRVRAAMRDLNYVPSRAARMLQSGRSRQIGVIVSDITNPYFAELVRSVTNAAARHDLDVMTLDTNYDVTTLEQHIERLYQYRCDGIFVFTTEHSQGVLSRLERSAAPVVVLNWGVDGGTVNQITVDYRPGLDALIAHLADLGHRRLAFAAGPAALHTANLKKEAFFAACAHCAWPLEPPLLLESDARLNLEMGTQLVATILAMPAATRPTALVVNNDIMAISIMRALHLSGVGIPDRLSVAGIDDIDTAAYVTPSLTSLRQPRRRMGELALEILTERMSGQRATGVQERVPVRLIIRESTGPTAHEAAMQG